MRKYISVGYASQDMIFCYSSPRRLIQIGIQGRKGVKWNIQGSSWVPGWLGIPATDREAQENQACGEDAFSSGQRAFERLWTNLAQMPSKQSDT